MSNPASIVVWPEHYLEAPDQPVSTLVVRRPMEHEVDLTLEDLRVLSLPWALTGKNAQETARDRLYRALGALDK